MILSINLTNQKNIHQKNTFKFNLFKNLLNIVDF